MRTAQLGLRCLVTACLVFALLAAPVGAESEIDIPFDDLIFANPGSVIELAEVVVDAELVGKTCHLAVLAKNQASVHIGNDLIVSTGDSKAVVVGVEDTPNGGTNRKYEMVVGSSIVVQMRIGEDGMSSLGFELSFDCDEPAGPAIAQQLADRPIEAPVTTIAPAAIASTTVAPTTVAPTTTVAPSTTVAPTTVAPVSPTVAGVVTNSLPQTPPASAVAGAPAYTG